MISTNTTLVLGAGASLAMGYPTGRGLRDALLQITSQDQQEFAIGAGLFNLGPPSIHEFVDAFRQSQMYSIDAFLARRPEFTQVGKQAIAAVLLKCEAASSLDRWNHADGWYQYLWNQFGTCPWEELDFTPLRIVTFNYDRSLEHYLLQVIQHSYGKPAQAALEKLGVLKIVHVYGVLGGALPGHTNYLKYGIGHPAAAVAAQSLQVIPEGRDDSATLSLARDHLLWANRIGFLGFGYDQTNMTRLNSETTCRRSIKRLVH